MARIEEKLFDNAGMARNRKAGDRVRLIFVQEYDKDYGLTVGMIGTVAMVFSNTQNVAYRILFDDAPHPVHGGEGHAIYEEQIEAI